MKIKLQESCNTALKCECGSQEFRIQMECDEVTNEISNKYVNNIECHLCHALYQVESFFNKT